MSRSRRIAESLGLRRSIVGVLSMAVLVGMGERMAERFLPVYLVALGAGQLWPGFLQAIDSGASALYSYPGGWLAERLGVKRALMVFDLVALAGYGIVIAVPSWPAVVAGSLLFISWSAVSLPGTMGLIAKSLPSDRQVMGVSMHSLVRRLPRAVGPILGGLFIDAWGIETGIRLAFVVAAAMAVVALVLQQVLIERDAPAAGLGAPSANPWRMFRSFSPALRNLFVADVLIRFCEQIPYAYVTIWCMSEVAGERTARVSATDVGWLTAIEMTTAMLCYIPVARWADRGGKKPFVLVTFVNFTLFPALLFFSRSFEMLALAFFVRGLKEFGEPTRKALILQLAPAERTASAFGAYYLFRDGIITLAAIGGAWLWRADPGLNLGAAFGCGVLGTLWFWRFGRDLTKES
ncbi:MAG: MFS transporter [Planctomycetota bacterium]